jgi:hypothetical protein
MKERPILFSGPMVRALLDGSKTQTRRVVKLPHNNPLGQWEPTSIGGENGGRTAAGETVPLQGGIWHTRTGDSLMCPHGQPGDRLWVRESYRLRRESLNGAPMDGVPPNMFCDSTRWFEADGAAPELFGKLRPSIHMPRWASRITLEVTGVRVERLQDISEADAEAEGINFLRQVPDADETLTPRELYMCLWDGLKPAAGATWADNPWVWVVEFKRA